MTKLKQQIRRINIKMHFWLLRNEQKRAFYIKRIALWTEEDYPINRILL